MSWLGPLTPPESEVAMLGAVTDADRILTSLVTEPIAMVSWEGRVDFPEAFGRMAKLERDLDHAVNKDDDGPVYLDELDPKRGDFNRDQPRQCSLFCPTDQPGGAP
ncbi:MAG: hypothetical protein GX471_09725 [Candidatus Microthrix parvicella]|nr:hypothetical protein [Candidatus Microthrix parvicella]